VRVTLLHNPGAGRQTRDDLRRLVKLLEDSGHAVRAQSVTDDDWEEALDWPADLVAAAGGDGTLARVAKRMLGGTVPLAPLPSGTANNISRTLGLVERPFEELVGAWPNARRVPLDVGLAKGPWGERHFVEGLGAGLFACLLARPSPQRAHVERQPANQQVAAVLELLREEAERSAGLDLAMRLDGKDLSGRYLLAEAVNIPYVGPNLFLAPDSQPGDGSFELVLVTQAERDRLKNYLATWQENRERLAVLPSHRGKRLELQWSGFALHIDDELWPGDEVRRGPGVIEITIAGQVEVLAPDAKEKPG
jgi:diacylglycerol kinase family enzyme